MVRLPKDYTDDLSLIGTKNEKIPSLPDLQVKINSNRENITS